MFWWLQKSKECWWRYLRLCSLTEEVVDNPEIVNATTVRFLYRPSDKPSKDIVQCQIRGHTQELDGRGICLSTVLVLGR